MKVSLRKSYQPRDYEIIDYGMVELPGTGMLVRGPLPDLSRNRYFSAIGAAQTLGCYCEEPYPTLVSRRIGLPVLNLGYPGAGAEFLLANGPVIDKINNGKFAVLQVMSGRSQSNSYYECGGSGQVSLRSDGRSMRARAAFQELLDGPPLVRRLPVPGRVRRKIGNLLSRSTARLVVEDIRSAWVTSNLELIGKIEVPIILLWYSKRELNYRQSYETVNKLWGQFPHLVDSGMVGQIRPAVDEFVECVTGRGSPQVLYSRFSRERITEKKGLNSYYPSPEMHQDAADALTDVCKKYA